MCVVCTYVCACGVHVVCAGGVCMWCKIKISDAIINCCIK